MVQNYGLVLCEAETAGDKAGEISRDLCGWFSSVHVGTLGHGKAIPTLLWNHNPGKPEVCSSFYWTWFAKVGLRGLFMTDYLPRAGQDGQFFFNEIKFTCLTIYDYKVYN